MAGQRPRPVIDIQKDGYPPFRRRTERSSSIGRTLGSIGIGAGMMGGDDPTVVVEAGGAFGDPDGDRLTCRAASSAPAAHSMARALTGAVRGQPRWSRRFPSTMRETTREARSSC